MNNPKTTIPGYLLIAAGVLTIIAKVLSGVDFSADLQVLMTAIGGIIGGGALVAAKDGGQ